MGRTRRGANLVLLVAVLVAAACSGGGSSGPTTVHELAAKLGCTELETVTDESQRPFGATGYGACQIASERVHLFTFDTDSAQDRAIRIGKEFGQTFVIGEGWMAGADSAATAGKVKAKLGGVVQ